LPASDVMAYAVSVNGCNTVSGANGC